MNGQGKDGFAQTGGDIQAAGYTGDTPIGFLMGYRHGIIDHGRDSPLFQQTLKGVTPAVFYLNRILVIDMGRKG